LQGLSVAAIAGLEAGEFQWRETFGNRALIQHSPGKFPEAKNFAAVPGAL
jgi:hypothetical protein